MTVLASTVHIVQQNITTSLLIYIIKWWKVAGNSERLGPILGLGAAANAVGQAQCQDQAPGIMVTRANEQ